MQVAGSALTSLGILLSNVRALVSILSKEYKDDKKALLIKHRKSGNSLRLFFKKPGEIYINLGQRLADTIISKLIFRNIITIRDQKHSMKLIGTNSYNSACCYSLLALFSIKFWCTQKSRHEIHCSFSPPNFCRPNNPNNQSG